MTLFWHELKRRRLSFLIWTGILALTLSVSVLMFPLMKDQMGDLTDMMAGMGELSEAFGMELQDLGDFWAYFGMECGDTLGLGGALFAALLGISALSKEEREHTAEFLLTHPVSRAGIVTEKLLAVLTEVVLLNVLVALVTVGCVLLIGEKVAFGTLALLLLAYTLLQAEIAALCFGLSACLRRGGVGIGLGVALGFYFLNLLANLDKDAKFLKYITPFGYADGGAIVKNGAIDGWYLFVGMLLGAAGIVLSYWRYMKKDIA